MENALTRPVIPEAAELSLATFSSVGIEIHNSR